jgi:hypothetical protein
MCCLIHRTNSVKLSSWNYNLQHLYNYYFLCSRGTAAEKTLQFQMMSLIDFDATRTIQEATPLLHIDYEVMLCQ